MIYIYCTLKFDKNYVTVFYDSETYSNGNYVEENSKNTGIGKEYKWTQQHNVITIKNFNDYGKLKIVDENLIGRKEMNYNEYKKIEFKEQ
jgi:hypothetical protein